MSRGAQRGVGAQAATGSVRLLRISVLTAASMALAMGAHAAGGGRLPGAGGLLLLSTGVALAASVLTATRLRGPALLAVVGVGQWLLHEALMALAALGDSAQSLSVHAHHGTMTMNTDGSAAMMGMAQHPPQSATMLGCHAWPRW